MLLQEKLHIALDCELGQDQEAAYSHEHELAILDRDVENFKKKVDKLAAFAEKMVQNEHHEASQVRAREGERLQRRGGCRKRWRGKGRFLLIHD